MSQGTDGSLTRHPVNSVPRIFRSLSQALRFTSPSPEIVNLVCYQNGKFVVSEEELLNILKNGTYQEQLECLGSLAQEIINLPPSKRMEIWCLIKRHVDLKNANGIRNAAFHLLSEVIKMGCLDPDSLMDCYMTIVESINLKIIDKDMKCFLICLEELLKSDDFIELFQDDTKYPLNKFLLKLFKQVSTYNEDDLTVMIISLITSSAKKNAILFSHDEMVFLGDHILNESVTTNNELVLKAAVVFFHEILQLDFNLDDRLYTLISVMGCANGLDDYHLKNKCEALLKQVISKVKDPGIVMSVLLQVIGNIDKDKYKHRDGDRSKVGCIRYLSSTLKHLGQEDDVGKLVTSYYKHHLNFMLDVFIVAAKSGNHSIKIEILKFIIELFETRYGIAKYYKLVLEKAIFWKLLQDLNWLEPTVMTYSYQEVLLELFNKLQNLPLNSFVQKELIEYFASNYSILTSYNIEYLLQYYSKNDLCVCGMANWKTHCKDIVEKYYCTAPASVYNVIKNAFMACNQLKIDEPSLKFYTDLLCYSCVLNLSFPLTEDEIVLPVVDMLVQIDDDMFDEVVSAYITNMSKCSSEINALFLIKVLIIYCTRMPNENNVIFIVNELVSVVMAASRSINKRLVFHYGIAMLTNLRLSNGQLFIKRITSIEDPKFVTMIRSVYKEVGKRRFENRVDVKKLMALYSFVLNDCDQWVYYFDLVKNLKLQTLNGILNQDGGEGIGEIFETLVKQLDYEYQFTFEIPSDLNKREIQLYITDCLYGFVEVKDKLPREELKKLLKYLIIDLKFDDFNRNQLVQFLNCCVYGIPDVIIEYLSTMIDILNKSINEGGYAILILETIMSIYFNRDKYTLRSFDFKCIFNILLEYMRPIIENQENLDRDQYLLFILSYELCNWYLPIIPPTDNSITNYVTSKLSDVVFNGVIDRFQMANLSIDLIDFNTNDDKFNELHRTVNESEPAGKRPLDRLIKWRFNLSKCTDSPFKIVWTSGISSMELTGKCIWVNRINDDNTHFYCVNTFGFDKIMVTDLIISSESVIKFVSTIIFICGTHIFMEL